MVPILSRSLSWLNNGEGESNIVVETLTKLLYGNGTSVIVTIKSDQDWSWEHIYDGGKPKVGVVYDLQNFNKLFYQGVITRIDSNMVDGEESLTLHVHFIGWPKQYDETWNLRESTGRIFTRGTYTRSNLQDVL